MAKQELIPMSQPVPPPTPGDENVTRKALHLKLKFEKLGTSRKVKTSEIDVGDADEKLVNVSKKLLVCPELKAIAAADSELKGFIKNVCLPFPEPSVRLVPYGAVKRVTKRLREHATLRPLLVDNFMAVYESEKQRDQTRLGHLHDASDYPPADAVRAEFSFSYEWVTFGPPAELAQIAPDSFLEELDKAAKTMQSAVELGQTFLLTSFAEMVERLKTSLTPAEDGKKRKLYDTAVTNLQEFIANFDLQNVSNYRELEAQVERAKAAVATVNTDQIRESETLREFVTKEMSEIENTLQTLVVTRTRKMRLKPEVQ